MELEITKHSTKQGGIMKSYELSVLESAQLEDTLEQYAQVIELRMLYGWKKEAARIRAMAAELTKRRQGALNIK